jgi:hypothetical protein
VSSCGQGQDTSNTQASAWVQGLNHFNLHSILCYTSLFKEPEFIKVFYLPTDAQQISFKRILKFTLKELQHISVQSPSLGSVLFELAKVIVIKIISLNTSLWLVRWCGCRTSNNHEEDKNFTEIFEIIIL